MDVMLFLPAIFNKMLSINNITQNINQSIFSTESIDHLLPKLYKLLTNPKLV